MKLWPFFREGIQYEARYLRYDYPFDIYRRILFHLVRDHEHAWVSVAADDKSGEPLAFVLAHDTTPLFAPRREFEVSMFYFRAGHKPAIRFLQQHFDRYCAENDVHRYYLTTSALTTSAKRVFHESWRGLEHSNAVFKREII